MAKKKQGIAQIGDIYDYDSSQPDNRGELVGRLAVDFDQGFFYMQAKGASKTSQRLGRISVGKRISQNLIEFDHEDLRSKTIQYLMLLDKEKKTAHDTALAAARSRNRTAELNENAKLITKVKRKTAVAKILWSIGCIGLVGAVFIATAPKAVPAAAVSSIAGTGQDYGIDSSVLQGATYLESMGSGSTLYGMVFNSPITEVGTADTSSGVVKENVMIRATSSLKQPIHMRPLYYIKNSFYQSQIKTNDSTGGSTAVYLENPTGYLLSVPANELVLTGGAGLDTVVIASPTSTTTSASDAATNITQKQNELINGRSTDSSSTSDQSASSLAKGWEGFDSCDIDGDKVVASYWYTVGNSQKSADLRRRVCVYNVSSVVSSGSSALTSLESAQMNWQDTASSFYNPVISKSPASNGSVYWIGYMKEISTGETGFFIRKDETNDDILLENYDNTLSTQDITGNNYPITNYTLDGDKLFYEQKGSIWVADLSKIAISINGTDRKITRENPLEICKASEIKTSISSDEQREADDFHTTVTPVAHYKPMTITTSAGVEYGIAFIESATGNLVFQPVVSPSSSATGNNAGTGATSSANGVESGDAAALAAAAAENEARNANKTGTSNSNTGTSNVSGNNGANTAQNSNNNNASGNGNVQTVTDGVVTAITGQQSATTTGTLQQTASAQPTSASATTISQIKTPSASSNSQSTAQEIDSGRILVCTADSHTSIICFTARGEQLVWIEQDPTNNVRKMKISPVYYKNDASKLLSEKTDTSNQNANTSRSSSIADNVSSTSNAVTTSRDVQVNLSNTTPNSDTTGASTSANSNTAANENSGNVNPPGTAINVGQLEIKTS